MFEASGLVWRDNASGVEVLGWKEPPWGPVLGAEHASRVFVITAGGGHSEMSPLSGGTERSRGHLSAAPSPRSAATARRGASNQGPTT